MPTALTFIIPVRHHANAKNWGKVRTMLSQTVVSIAAQTSRNWQAVIVANEDSLLPELPAQFSIARVAYPPNEYHERDGLPLEEFYEAFRMDKGRRVLTGMLHARQSRHLMIVDADDLVHCGLTQYVESHPNENGWRLSEGWIWPEGSRLLYRSSMFDRLCGTSHIIRTDLYALPMTVAEANDTYVKRCLGSHIFIEGILRERGFPLKSLPFAGAVYRVGHTEAHSRSASSPPFYISQKGITNGAISLSRLRFTRTFWGDPSENVEESPH